MSKWTLDGVNAKLERADQNIVDFYAEIRSFLKTDVDSSFIDENFDLENELVKPHLKRIVPPRFSVLAGECIHNLHSCLDQLAWQLVIANDATPSDKTSFPIYTFDPSRDKDIFKRYDRAIEGMSDTAKTKIERLQPYKSGNGGSDNPLAILYRLSIADKHHALLKISPAETHTESILRSDNAAQIPIFNPFVIRQMEENGAVSISAQGGRFPVNVDRQITLRISFSELSGSSPESVIETLWKLWNAIWVTFNELLPEFK